jgi:hypothetical protein
MWYHRRWIRTHAFGALCRLNENIKKMSERFCLFNKYVKDAVGQLPVTFDCEDVCIFVCKTAEQFELKRTVEIVVAERGRKNLCIYESNCV